MGRDRAQRSGRWLRAAAAAGGALAAGVLLLAGCAADPAGDDATDPAGDDATATAGEDTPPAPAEPPDEPAVTEVAYRIEARVGPAEADAFAATVRAVLADPRGWVRAGFVFVERAEAPYTIVLAEGPEVDALCRPYETHATYSCQNGPVVALNADRWRSATPQWPAGIQDYRTMLVNHEIGHLLHLHHPDPQCPGPGLPAPVMAQQSTELGACRPHPWPLQWEVDLAAERREPFAPPAHHDPSDHRPSPPPATR